MKDLLNKVLLLVLFLPLLGLGSLKAQKKTPFNVKATLNEILEQKGMPGITLSTIQKEQKISVTAGLADREEKISLQADHRMLLGSIGKTFFSAQVMMLIDEGILDLDKKVVDYLAGEEWFLSVQNAQDITIRSLLNHTSGVPEYVYAQEMWKIAKNDPKKEWTAGERLALVADQPAHFPVGEGWCYADANYIILGAVVEKVTGKKIYDLVQRNILDPHGLQATSPSVTQEMKGITAAYTGRMFGDIFGEKVSEIGRYGMGPQFEWTGGGFITTSSDLARWVNKLYTGKVLKPELTKMIFTPVNRQTGAASTTTGYGFGSEIFATPYGLAYGHTGFMPGFVSLMAYLPDYDLAIALQVNSDPYNKQLKERFSVFEILNRALPHFVERNVAYGEKTKLHFVRHAEKADDDPRDPSLSETGQARAENLAKVLESASIDAIYSTNFKRTKDTGQPLAKALGIEIQTYSPFNDNALNEIIANNQGKNVLIIGHSNTTPNLVNQVAKKANLSQLPDSQYGDLFIVTYKKGKGKLKRKQF